MELWTYETTRGPATLRLARLEDIPSLIQLNKHCFPSMAEQNVVWNRGQLQNHIRLFPEGQIVVEMGGVILGACSSLIVSLGTDDYRPHTYSGITDGGYFHSHDPEGDTLYGAAGNDTIFGEDNEDMIFGGTGADLYGVRGTDANNVWTVGSSGALKWSGTSWSAPQSGSTRFLYSLWGADASNLWSVGFAGSIAKGNGTTWTTQASLTQSDLFGVWGAAANNVWATGRSGTIRRWDGTTWSPQASGTTGEVISLWGTDANNVWAAVYAGQIVNGNYQPCIRTYAGPQVELSGRLRARPT